MYEHTVYHMKMLNSQRKPGSISNVFMSEVSGLKT